MNSDFVLSQLRAGTLAIIAYLAGRGLFTPADATFATALVTAFGPILVPFAMSVYSNWATKKVRTDSVAAAVAKVEAKPDATATAIVNAASAAVAKAAAAAFLLGVLVLGSFQPAHAQIRSKAPQVTGDLIADIKANNAAGVTPAQGLDATWAKMKSVSLDDLKYAKALADAVGSSRSKIRSTCYGAWIVVIEQSQGATAGANGQPLGAPPDPALFTKFEQAVQVADNLQPDSPFMVACQPAANLLKQSILQFVTSAVGGVTSLGTLGLGIP